MKPSEDSSALNNDDSSYLLNISNQRILFDTNILMLVENDSGKHFRETLFKLAEQNEICICDTVFYELLRNLNAKRFRERHSMLRQAGLKCLEENNVCASMFERLCLLYLSFLRAEFWNYIHRRQDDLWIIAAGLSNGVTQFLTTDKSADFLPHLFKTTKYVIQDKKRERILCLHTFNNEAASSEWTELVETEKLEIKLPKGYLSKIKSESWAQVQAEREKSRANQH